MTFHTETFCDTLDSLDARQAIRAIHQAYLQFSAVVANCDTGHYDNAPAIAALKACLAKAGHPAGDA
jgi:hypothetical protein